MREKMTCNIYITFAKDNAIIDLKWIPETILCAAKKCPDGARTKVLMSLELTDLNGNEKVTLALCRSFLDLKFCIGVLAVYFVEYYVYITLDKCM